MYSPTTNLLYIRTKQSIITQTICKYTYGTLVYHGHVRRVIAYLLYQNHRSTHVQSHISKQFLKINKLIPLYIDKHLILFPVKHQRAAIQYYVNACEIIGISIVDQQTCIHFSNRTQLFVDDPPARIEKKWKECVAMHTYHP